MRSYDYVVIGAGSGGLASAKRAAAHGASVAIIEGGRLGGTCVNVGCVPKKVMWNAASIAEHIRMAKSYGFSLETSGLDWAHLKRTRDAYVTRLNGIYDRGLGLSGVELIEGWAKFVDPHTLDVNGEKIQAKHILIATGGRPTLPDVPGAELGITSDGFFELEEQPKHVAIVGAGYIAVEIAGVMKALGSKVTVLLRNEQLLRSFDAQLRETLMEEMAKEGIHFVTCIELDHIEKDEQGLLTLAGNEQKLSGFDCLLWAIGRTPNTDQLGLEEVGVVRDDNGFIRVNEYEDTDVPHIHAVGDVTGRIQLTPVAIAAGRKLSDRLFAGHSNAKMDYSDIATVIFSHPPIGTVGLSEAEANEEYGVEEVHVYTSTFTNMYYSMSDHKVQTCMKVVAVGEKRKIVGIHGIGMGMDEMIQGFAVALKMGATVADLNRTVAIHPTASEELVLIG
ncbi:MAG: glutathione-disulfide reductase [Deltaproteobacteria bacterium]|nr:MAG: glutathione-disulfide reductase [Deltaproteobacteria bacterium]